MKITRKQLFNYLADPYQPRCEPDQNGNVVYHVHIDEDGALVHSSDEADVTLTSVLCNVSGIDGDTMGDVYDKETEADEDFQTMLDDFMHQLEKLDNE